MGVLLFENCGTPDKEADCAVAFENVVCGCLCLYHEAIGAILCLNVGSGGVACVVDAGLSEPEVVTYVLVAEFADYDAFNNVILIDRTNHVPY